MEANLFLVNCQFLLEQNWIIDCCFGGFFFSLKEAPFLSYKRHSLNLELIEILWKKTDKNGARKNVTKMF